MPQKHTFFKTIAIAAVSSIAAIGAAQAGDHAEFAYKESDLQSTANIQNLYKRIENRAESFCGVDNARAIYAKQSAASCEARLVEDWVAGINDSRLNRLHAQSGAQQIAAAN